MTTPAAEDGACSEPADDAARSQHRRFVAGVWLAVWVGLSVWVCNTLADAWPYVQLPPQLVLLVAVPGVLFRSAELALMGRRGRPLDKAPRRLLRIGSILAGVVIASYLWEAMDERSMARFERVMAPLVDELRTNSSPCPPPPAFLSSEVFRDYRAASNAPGRRAEVYADGRPGSGRFVLAFSGRSIDIDGSTIFYDSAVGAWRKVHNDTLASTQEFETLTKNLAVCRIELP
jgi:hypothetical protein